MAGEWWLNACVHRVKGDRLVSARVLPVCDNDKGLNKSSFSNEYSYVREILNGVREKSGSCQGILFCPVCMNPAVDSRRVVVSYKGKYVHKELVNPLAKLALEKKVWLD